MSTMTTVTKLGGTQPSATSTTNIGGSVHEYSIRVPKNGSKKYHVMRFNATTVDFSKWSQVKMERENNMKEYKGIDEEQPKFGAGSEFGRDAREEARRKKLGFVARKYKPDDQPWILKSGGKTGKKFKGVREGGVSENTAYYVFTHAADGAIEAFPLQEWYNFQPIQRYKALSAEEAEVEFGKRNRVINFFSLMLRKRLKGDEELDGEEGAGEDAKGRKGNSKKAKELKISEMDEWMDSSSEDESSDGEKKEKEEDEEEDKKKKKKAVPRKKKPRDTDAEAFEDSDDGDDEGRELDYISSSSESEPEAEKQLQGVEEEKALRKLLTSDESSDDEENKSNKDESNEEEKEQDKDKNKEEKEPVDKKKKKKKKKESNSKKKKDEKAKDSSSALSSDSTDSEKDEKKKKKASSSAGKDLSTKDSTASENGSRPASPGPNGSDAKRKLTGTPDISATKKLKLDGSISAGYISGSSDSGITEDAVRRYLMRKPMTTTELLQKFKTKKTGLSSEQLVNIMTQILKKINPVRKTIKGKMYLSIKS